jgi:hypothetical protein
MAPTALPARQGAPVAADGNDFAETRFDLPEADDDESMRMLDGGGPNTGGRGTVGRRY